MDEDEDGGGDERLRVRAHPRTLTSVQRKY